MVGYEIDDGDTFLCRQGRSVALESEIESFLDIQTAKEYASLFTRDEFKQIVEESFREALTFSPVELGLLFIGEIDNINEDKDFITALLFSEEELESFATWAQKYYYQQYGSPDFNFGVAFILANIKTRQNVLTKVVEPAKQELVAMMRLHPEDFAKEIITNLSENNKSIEETIEKTFARVLLCSDKEYISLLERFQKYPQILRYYR